MPNYRWTCLACEAGNSPEDICCQSCGCPIEATGMIVEGWKKSLTQAPKKPSLISIGFFTCGVLTSHDLAVAPCPRCKCHMYATDAKCPHCSYQLLLKERHNLISQNAIVESESWNIGLIFFSLVAILLAIILPILKEF